MISDKDRQFNEEIGRYNRILEYVSLNGSMNEVGENDPEEEGPEGPMPTGAPGVGGMPAGGPENGGAPMGGPEGDAPMAGPGGAGPMDGPDGGGVEGFDPEGPEQGEDVGNGPEPDMGTDPMAGGDGLEGNEDDEGDDEADEIEVDVGELVDSQEGLETKLDKLSKKFSKLIKVVNSFEKSIDSNTGDLEALHQELIKRNPSPVEKLSMRSMDSFPYNVGLDRYWEDKQATSNYSVEDDKNGEDNPVYQINKSDIDNVNDYRSIEKSLDDGSYNMTLKDILGY